MSNNRRPTQHFKLPLLVLYRFCSYGSRKRVTETVILNSNTLCLNCASMLERLRISRRDQYQCWAGIEKNQTQGYGYFSIHKLTDCSASWIWKEGFQFRHERFLTPVDYPKGNHECISLQDNRYTRVIWILIFHARYSHDSRVQNSQEVAWSRLFLS